MSYRPDAGALPVIEVACLELGTAAPIDAEGFEVGCEPRLISSCVPARFQPELDALTGRLYRLGNGPSAYGLLSVACRETFPPSFLEFAPEHLAEVRSVLERIVAASPRGQALFTTDWQYGPESAHRFGPLTLPEFWTLHASRHLYLNTAYLLEHGP
jgi:hypothetical protein